MYGEKIAELRKSKGMTQAALGAELNVTYQAVSKWERDESDPDFATMSKIAKLFGVPLSYFEEGEGDGEAAATAAAEPVPAPETAPAEDPVPAPAPVTAADTEEVYNKVYADIRRREAQEKEEARRREIQESAERRKRAKEIDKEKELRLRNIGLIVGGACAAAILIAAIVGCAVTKFPAGASAVCCILALIFGFTFFTQVCWEDGFVREVLGCGFKIIGTPGIIFTFDLDGFIFLIIMKVLFAVLKFLVLMLCLLFFTIGAILISPFSFVPQLIKISRGNM